MELEIITKNGVALSEAIETYARKRLSKLDRYLPSLGEGKLEISQENAKFPDQRFTVQVTLGSKGVLIRAQEKAEDLRTAIDKVMDALTSRIKRYKGKLYDRSKGLPLALQGTPEETEEFDTPKVVKSKRFLVKPMFQDEAVNQMELLGHDFFLFISGETGSLNLLYRRKDGNYGLIETDTG